MQLKIATTQNTVIFSGKVEQVVLPTETGAVTIYKNHLPVIFRLVPGIIRLVPDAQDWKDNLLQVMQSFSISKWIAFIDPKNIRITVSVVTTTSSWKLAELYANRSLLEKQLKKLKRVGNIEDIQRIILQLEKVKADISLSETLS